MEVKVFEGKNLEELKQETINLTKKYPLWY